MDNEFVMVPRELIERIERAGVWPKEVEELRALLAQPAAQHQGEPVGMLLIDDYFDSREVGEVDVKLDSKVCEQLAANYPGQSLALYTHADTGDILYAAQMLAISKNECDRLRAQLAERGELLRHIYNTEPLAAETSRRIEAVLSASAEPSAPQVTLVSYAEDMSTCTLTKGDGIGYFYDRIEEPKP